MLLDAQDSQLVLVDYQERLMPAIEGADEVLQRARTLARVAQLLEVPIWGTEQVPQKLGRNDPELRQLCRRTVEKDSFDGCEAGLIDCLKPAARSGGNARSLPKHLQKAVPAAEARQTVVIAGCETHICLLQTALSLVEHEFDVWVVTDACGSRRSRDRDAALDRLAGNGVELVTLEMVAFEWLRSSRHPAFRDVQALIK